MTTKDILHKILLGMDPYISVGVPEVYWELANVLTMEVYGEAGINLLKWAHQTYDASVQGDENRIMHSLHVWETPYEEVCPKELIEKLEQLVSQSDSGLIVPRSNMRKARLIEVHGEQEEFADLIGVEGNLYLGGSNDNGDRDGNNWFIPKQFGDMLSLAVKQVIENGGKVKVLTKLGNTFTFRLV